jgi:hypothetical protein
MDSAEERDEKEADYFRGLAEQQCDFRRTISKYSPLFSPDPVVKPIELG